MLLTKSWHDILADSTPESVSLDLLSIVAPDIFGEGKVTYILPLKATAYREVNCSGFAVSRDMMSWIRPDIEKLNLWRGDGNAILINVNWRTQSPRYLALLIHEAAHVIEGETVKSFFDSPVPRNGATLADRRRTIKLVEAFRKEEEAKPIPTIKKWIGHGWEWIRSVCHLVHRCNELGLKLNFSDVQFAGPSYGLSEGRIYHSTLIPELEASVEKPFAEIFKSRPPEKFCELWKRNTGLEIK